MGIINTIEQSVLRWQTPKNIVNLKQLKYAPAPRTPKADEFIKNETAGVPKVTNEDIYKFRAYMLGKQVDTKVSPEEIQHLFSFEGEEFKLKSFQLLTEKLKIPKQITPQFIYSDEEKSSAMFYNYISNTIAVNPDYNFSSKAEFLSALRHEFQHLLQNINIYRHETKGKEAVNLYAKLGANNECQRIHDRAMDLSLEQIKKLGFNEEGIAQYKYLQNLLDNEQFKEYEQVLNNTRKSLQEYNTGILENFRKTIVDSMGELKADSKEGKRAEKFFNEISGNNYWEADGGIDYGKYFGDAREIEAMIAGDMIGLKSAPELKEIGCYIKLMKEAEKKMEAFITENETNKITQDIENSVKEYKAKGINCKDLISYLFD